MLNLSKNYVIDILYPYNVLFNFINKNYVYKEYKNDIKTLINIW